MDLLGLPSPAPRVTHLGVEDMVLLPEVVHDSKDAEWPSKTQKVSQDTECTAEDQASPKGMTEGPPDGPGTLLVLRVLPLPRESHRQVRVAEGSDMEIPSFRVTLGSCCLGEALWPCCL